MTQKILMSLEELSTWFTERVRKASTAKDATITVQYRLVKPDHLGKSWSDSLVVNAGTGSFQEVLHALADAHREAVETIDLA